METVFPLRTENIFSYYTFVTSIPDFLKIHFLCLIHLKDNRFSF